MKLEELNFLKTVLRDDQLWLNYITATERSWEAQKKCEPGKEYESREFVLAELSVERAKNALLLETLNILRDRNKIDCSPLISGVSAKMQSRAIDEALNEIDKAKRGEKTNLFGADSR